jgi:hypothetical protein
LIDWPSYNRSLVRRGEILFSHDFLETWDSKVDRMNKNKKGKPFIFPDSFILAIGHIRLCFHLPYRQTEGVIKATGKSLPSYPSYGHVCKRINKRLNVGVSNSIDDYDDYIVIAVDSTGIKITNRGQWMSDKWGLGKKKGYIKIHVAVNIRTKEVLALNVTDEKILDGKIMKKLVENVLEVNQNDKKIKSLLGDGAYDSNNNFRFLNEKRIDPIIKVKRNSAVILSRNNKIRNKEVKQQTKDFLKWKKTKSYGHRWIAETAFSPIKRMFGEHIMATIFNTYKFNLLLGFL